MCCLVDFCHNRCCKEDVSDLLKCETNCKCDPLTLLIILMHCLCVCTFVFVCLDVCSGQCVEGPLQRERVHSDWIYLRP